MLRTAAVTLAALAVLGTVSIVTWYLTFRVGARPPSQIADTGSFAEIRIEWASAGDAVVHLEDDRDLPRALGFVHALGKPWPLLLIRQAALGRLSEWYGQSAIRHDRHVRQLGLPTASLQAWDELPVRERRLVEAYTEGINRALRERRIRLAPAIAALDVTVSEWEPWHSLAVERLLGWFGASVSTDSAAANSAGDRLVEQRGELGAFLGIGGLTHSAAWHMEGQPPGLFVRWVYGSTGVPPITAVRVTGPSGERDLATWTGIPVAWAGRRSDRAWAVLPTSHARIDTGRVTVAASYEHIRLRDGGRDVAARISDGGRLDLGGGWILTWPGLSGGSDLPAVADVSDGLEPTFRLFDGIALIVHGSERVQSMGRTATDAGMTVVSSAPEAPYLAASLATIDEVGPERVFQHAGSTWGAERAADLAGRASTDSTVLDREPEAVRYVQNWDGTYDGASIGSSIVEAALPRGGTSAALVTGVEDLRKTLGGDPSAWRWERQPDAELAYPGYVRESDHDAKLPARYAGVPVARIGHPTAPAWGSAPSWVTQPAPAAFEAFIDAASGGFLRYRRPHVPFDALLGRYSGEPEDRALRIVVSPNGDRLRATLLSR